MPGALRNRLAVFRSEGDPRVIVARQVYQGLGGGTAMALDSAVRALREKRRTQPWLWAPYIHVGP